MNHQEGKLTLAGSTKAAGDQLYFQSWAPDGAAKAVVLLVHGYDEHSARYQYFAQHCVDRDMAVYAIDHWGHGKSDGINGFVPEFKTYHDGLDALGEQIQSSHPGLPLILVGHSLGGLISASYLVANQKRFTTAILSGPAIKAAEEPSAILKIISRILSRVFPKMGVLGLDANGVSRDPAVVADYLADPLVSGNKISARLAAEMLKTMEDVQQKAAAIELPLLMLHGAEDSLADPVGSTFLNEHISSTEKQLIIYPELFHEIFNEPEKDKVLTDMTDWIETRLSKDST